MTNPTDEEILKAAGKINDGEQTNLDIDITTDKSGHEVLAALKKIDQITRNIRKHSEISSLQMAPGDQWAHLQITQKIGQGGIGEVYCAYDPILDSQVAVKFLSKKSQLYISQQQFLDEARYMATVRHPHVLAIHGATVDQNIAGYWSDYLDGTLLSEQIKSQPLKWQQQLKYAKQLCQAVKAIHSNQLVHGDIKSLNVMLQPERGAILLDFGSSRKNDNPTTEAFIQQASPMAMAPEQFKGQPASQATDVFSLGLVFWHLSSPNHPLDGLDIDAIKQRIDTLYQQTNLIKGPKAWRSLVQSMLQANPASRPSIQAVENSILSIISSPARKAKRIATTSLLVLAAGITIISIYSNYKTTQANKETEAMNTLLSDILMTSSPLNKGKDVLLMDVLLDAQNELLANQDISHRQKVKSLLQLLQTFRSHSNHSQAQELATMMLAQLDVTDSEKLDLLMQKADILNRTRKFEESEPMYLAALNISPADKKDADVLVLSHVGLIKNYLETKQLKKVPPLIKAAKTTWENSNKKQSNLGLIHQIEGNYHEFMKQFDRAFTMYQKAQQNFESFYGPKNLNVLIAKGNAATVLTFTEETRQQGAQMMEELIVEMTEFLGPEHTSTLIARANLSSIYGQLNQPKKALETIVPYLPFVYQAFGKEGGTTMAFENIVAELYVVDGNHDKADEMFTKIIAVHTKTNGANAKATLNARLKRITFLQQTEQLETANQSLLNMHQIAIDSLPENDRLTLDIEEALIWNQHLQGAENALSDMQKLNEKKSTLFGPDDPSTLSTGNRLNEMNH